MNQKAYSVLFCALLASTFVHELRAKGVAPVNPQGLDVIERVERSVAAALDLSVQVIAGLLVIVNAAANVALVIDITAGVFVLLNGNTGSGVCIDHANNKGSYISSGLWLASSVSLAVFLGSLVGGIVGLLVKVGATLINLKLAVDKKILQVVTDIVICLVSNISIELERDLTLALELVISIVDGLLDLLRGVLEGLLDLIGDLVIDLAYDICALLNVLQGLGQIIGLVGGTLADLVEKDIEFKLALILGAVDGLVCLLNIIQQLGDNIDLTPLADILGSVESLFTLIAQLGGNLTVGITGVFKVVAELLAYINGEVTLEIFIGCLVQYVAYSSVAISVDLTVQLNTTLSLLSNVLVQVKANVVLEGLVGIVEDLVAGTLTTVGTVGINLSTVISKLLVGVLGAVEDLLVLIVEILVLLKDVIAVALSVPYLLMVLLCKLNSALGIQQLKAIGIIVNLDLGIIVGSILKWILGPILNLVAILTGNLYDPLCGLPIIGPLVIALSKAVSAGSNGTLSLKTLLNASALVQSLIRGLFQFVTGLLFGMSASIVAQAKAILLNCTSVGVSVSVVFDIVISSTG